jgi:hypothetical protein
MFTQAYIGWWGGRAADLSFDRGIRREIELGFNKLPLEQTTMKFRRPSNKVFRLNVAGDAKKAYAYGVKKAEQWLVDRDRDYHAMARARRRSIDR